MKKIWFITGTDTDVGKTLVSMIFLKYAIKMGFKTAGYKPFSTGCINTIYGLRNHDALFLKKNSSIKFLYSTINPFSYYNFAPPNFLIHSQSAHIIFNHLSDKLNILKNQVDWIIVEGIGGLLTPIINEINMINWIKKEDIPIILVIGIKIGCMNHAMLMNETILKYNLKFSGWLVNNVLNTRQYCSKYIDFFKKNLNAPFLGKIPYIQNMQNIENILQSMKIDLPD